MNYSQTLESLINIFRDVVAKPLKEYVKNVESSNKFEKPCIHGTNKEIVTKWQDNDGQDQLIIAEKYIVGVDVLFLRDFPFFCVSYIGEDTYMACIHFSDGAEIKHRLQFHKNPIEITCDKEKSYICYDEEALLCSECEKFLIGFIHDVFPESENDITQLFEEYKRKKKDEKVHYLEAREILVNVMTETVAKTVRKYVQNSINANMDGHECTNGTNEKIVTAWYDPEDYNCFELVGKYEVSGDALFSNIDPYVIIRYKTVDEYSLQVPCSENCCKSFKVIFSKNLREFYTFKSYDPSKAFVIYEEEALKHKEFKEFLTKFIKDAFPDKEDQIKVLFKIIGE